jgi:hypothetical protein
MRCGAHRRIGVVSAVICFAMLSIMAVVIMLRSSRAGLVVTYETAVLHEPAGVRSDDRSALDHAEPFDLRVFGGDLDVDAERGAVFDGFGP